MTARSVLMDGLSTLNILAQNSRGWVDHKNDNAQNRQARSTLFAFTEKTQRIFMSQKKKTDKNSVTAAVQAFKGAIETVSLPEGIELRSELEHTIWGQFTRARAREDWRDLDLILLAKVVRMEADIRQHQDTLDRSGVLIQNKRGTLVANPLLSVVDTLERRQLAVIRSMSLNQLASDPRTINGAAQTQSQSRNLMEDFRGQGLIAMPMN